MKTQTLQQVKRKKRKKNKKLKYILSTSMGMPGRVIAHLTQDIEFKEENIDGSYKICIR